MTSASTTDEASAEPALAEVIAHWRQLLQDVQPGDRLRLTYKRECLHAIGWLVRFIASGSITSPEHARIIGMLRRERWNPGDSHCITVVVGTGFRADDFWLHTRQRIEWLEVIPAA